VAGAAPEKLPGALDYRREDFAELLGSRKGLCQLGQMLELTDPLARLLVQARVLDCAADERGRGGEELDLLGSELARRLRVHRDRADDVAIAPGDGDGEERLELLFLQLGHELVARVADGVLCKGRLTVLDGPPGYALAVVQGDLADELPVRLRGCPEHEPVILDQVDETGMDRARIRQEPHDGAQDLAEVEGRSDSRDDLVEDPLARLRRRCPLRHAGIVRRLGVRY
jgi:hypothetical protein